MEHWTQEGDTHKLKINEDLTIDIYPEEDVWHCGLTQAGESIALFYGRATVEDRKIDVATLLGEMHRVAIMNAFRDSEPSKA